MPVFHRKVPKVEYAAPESLDEALTMLSSSQHGEIKMMAGGTDLVPKLKRREIQNPACVLDLKRIEGLNHIRHDKDSGLNLGPLATIHDVAESPVVKDKFSILSEAASSIGSVQVRNRGTVVGNICNAVPSADTAPALLTMQAELKIARTGGERTVNIDDFFAGPYETVLGDDELVQEIRIPPLPQNAKGRYLKLTPRKSMDLAIVGVAVVLVAEKGVCKDIRIALGAVAPTPMRAKRAEEALKGINLGSKAIEDAARIASEESCPIDDHRASAEYRREMVKVLTRRAIHDIISPDETTRTAI
ncbi:MAG: FAD binding domain-containing protein [Dehalococcoidia bacterium]